MSLIMADLDLLRDINNTYGHLAGDAVLAGVAEVFREQLRHYDVPARFGGEEFAILLPGDRAASEALEIAERIRRAVAARAVRGRDLERADPRHASRSASRRSRRTAGTRTSSSTRPTSPSTARSSRAGTASSTRGRRAAARARRSARRGSSRVPPAEDAEPATPLQPADAAARRAERRRRRRPHAPAGPRFLALSRRLAVLVALVGVAGIAAGVVGHPVRATRTDVARAWSPSSRSSASARRSRSSSRTARSRSAPSARSRARRSSGLRAALAARGHVARRRVERPARRRIHQLLFNVGALASPRSPRRACSRPATRQALGEPLVVAAAAWSRALAYFAVNTGLLSVALAHRRPRELVARLARALRLAAAALRCVSASSPA